VREFPPQQKLELDWPATTSILNSERSSKTIAEIADVSIDILTDAPPLHAEADGAVRIGESRVLLELVIRAFQEGATAEAIVQRYPTTTLSDIYAVIAYYLRHSESVNFYLSEREQQAVTVRQQIESRQGNLSEIRNRLLARQTS
jgi:uncharacterized protein (DUF433 family)